MWARYGDILSRIDETPLWFDECAVPRFEPFTPDMLANIYASETVLMLIRCQACRAEFHVALSARGNGALAAKIQDNTIHFGDPPNTGCCDVGATENSVAVRVLEYWLSPSVFAWERDASLEIPIVRNSGR